MITLTELPRGAKKVSKAAKNQTAQLLKDMLITLASLVLPNHAKRALGLVALYRHLVDVHVLRNASLSELNEKLGLAMDEKALRFPEHYYNRIWSSEDIRRSAEVAGIFFNNEPVDNLDKNFLRSFCQQLAKTSPPHLRYGSTEDLFSDFLSLFERIGGNTLYRA